MSRYLLLFLVLAFVAGCAFAQDTLRLLEPVIDAGAKFAADSAGLAAEDAVKKHLGDAASSTWTGGEIAGATGGIVMSAYAALKAFVWSFNRKPKDA